MFYTILVPAENRYGKVGKAAGHQYSETLPAARNNLPPHEFVCSRTGCDHRQAIGLGIRRLAKENKQKHLPSGGSTSIFFSYKATRCHQRHFSADGKSHPRLYASLCQRVLNTSHLSELQTINIRITMRCGVCVCVLFDWHLRFLKICSHRRGREPHGWFMVPSQLIARSDKKSM